MTTNRHLELLEQAKAHFAADMLVKGTYGTGSKGSFKGCSVGCHLSHILPGWRSNAVENKHKIVADYYGYPEWLAHLQDTVFEGLPAEESNAWHVQLAEAIVSRNGDIDWQRAFHRIQVGILRIALRVAGSSEGVVQQVIDLHERAAAGEVIPKDLWNEAARAAEAAAAAARAAEAAAAAARAAWAAAAAARAAEATGATAAGAAAAAYREIRDVVLRAITESGGVK